LYAATWTEYVLPEGVAVAVFETVAAGAGVASVFTTGDAGDTVFADDTVFTGDTAFAGTVSTALTSLAALTPVSVEVDGAVAGAAGAGGVASAVGGFIEATDTAGGGQR
jgi:hypothetical protein